MATPMLSLKHATFTQFMLRQQSLKLYRDILRSLRQLDNKDQAKEIRQWARQDFESCRHLQDPEAIKMHLARGKLALKELHASLQLAK
ncbi:LYR motif-containing protein 2-like isoform X1 [Varroa jacobsoni]|uniref:LYR motif-containing protein 2 n=1 Tax=Varroa destructor TaxID=109461 RepID=A0A7M7MDY4_VARDE|nr:LYR motif-containing protein 2-like isoform X2 [Varroa destructor]XP_022694984.1 LYR motif-containing protein 2-like isoform X1 [Varroa jacobsoni]